MIPPRTKSLLTHTTRKERKSDNCWLWSQGGGLEENHPDYPVLCTHFYRALAIRLVDSAHMKTFMSWEILKKA